MTDSRDTPDGGTVVKTSGVARLRPQFSSLLVDLTDRPCAICGKKPRVEDQLDCKDCLVLYGS